MAMAQSKGITLKTTHQFLNVLFSGDVHAKRIYSLANATLGVICSGSLAVNTIGHGLALARGRLPKHTIKQVNKGKFDRVGALLFEVRALRVLWRAASRNESPGGRASSLGAAERYLVFARTCGSGGVEDPPQIQIGHFEFDLVRAA